MLVVDPGKRLLALTSIFFFGLCVAKITRMLVLRRRAAITQPLSLFWRRFSDAGDRSTQSQSVEIAPWSARFAGMAPHLAA
jgi:hypothetical protein